MWRWYDLNSDETGKWDEVEWEARDDTCVQTWPRRINRVRLQASVHVDFHPLSSRLVRNELAFPTDTPLRRENFSGFTSSCYIKIRADASASQLAVRVIVRVSHSRILLSEWSLFRWRSPWKNAAKEQSLFLRSLWYTERYENNVNLSFIYIDSEMELVKNTVEPDLSKYHLLQIIL